MSRRTKLNPEVQKRILQAIQTGATYEVAAGFGGITRQTLFYWLQRGEEKKEEPYLTFFNEFKKAEARCCVGALAVVQKAAQTGTWQAAAFLLERRFDYTKQQQPPIQVSIDIENVDSKTLIAEYKTHLASLIEGPVIDLDEE